MGEDGELDLRWLCDPQVPHVGLAHLHAIILNNFMFTKLITGKRVESQRYLGVPEHSVKCSEHIQAIAHRKLSYAAKLVAARGVIKLLY